MDVDSVRDTVYTESHRERYNPHYASKIKRLAIFLPSEKILD